MPNVQFNDKYENKFVNYYLRKESAFSFYMLLWIDDSFCVVSPIVI